MMSLAPTMQNSSHYSNRKNDNDNIIMKLSRNSSISNVDEPSTGSAVFNSVDFSRFLSKEFRSDEKLMNGSIFLSKDSALPSFDTSSIFQSKDSFSSLFASKEWNMKFPHQDVPPAKATITSAPAGASDGSFKSFLNTIQPKAKGDTSALEDHGQDDLPELVPSDVLKSKDWMPQNTLGDHVDVPYTAAMFSSAESSNSNVGNLAVKELELPPARHPSFKTDWDDVFWKQLEPPAPSVETHERAPQEPQIPQDIVGEGMTTFNLSNTEQEASAAPTATAVVQMTQNEPAVASSLPQAPKKKRKRAPRKKVVPANKTYVELNDLDVLCGRGGRTNHHPGNKRYLEEVLNLKEWYQDVTDKHEKTKLSQCLVDYVQSYGARFVDKDETGWYIVDNIVARRKASQALREDNDPEKRAAKRARFLAKRAKEQQAASNKLKQAKP